MDYFSDKENGPRPRTEENISPTAWAGIVALAQASVNSGAFGCNYPETCPDGAGPVGNDEHALSQVLRAEIPDLEWPLKTTKTQNDFPFSQEPFAPESLVILDFIEFCFRSISKPIQRDYHEFFKHYHLSFDRETGQEEFRKNVNRIFARNGIAYELSQQGRIERLAPAVLREALSNVSFFSGDSMLDAMLEEARRKFLSPDIKVRREALERLWDGWERLKSLSDPSNKKLSVAALLDNAAPKAPFRDVLEKEARELTEIGNSFHIRHTEVLQTPVTSSAEGVRDFV